MNKIVKLVLLPIFLSIFSNATATEKINEIIVNGNQKIETSEVKEYCGLYEGQDFSSTLLDSSNLLWASVCKGGHTALPCSKADCNAS